MNDRRYFWVFDREIFDQIELPEFTLLEGVLIVASLAGLGLYLLLIVALDARSRLKVRRAKQFSWLERWLDHAQLSAVELAGLDRLAGGEGAREHYDLLGNPVRFEARVFEAIRAGRQPNKSLAQKLRHKLGYTSHNLRIPVVSTHQLQPEDPVRMTCWSGGQARHFYGKVSESGLRRIAISARPEAVKTICAAGEADLFYIRGLGIEYPFTGLRAQPGKVPDQLTLEHTLARPGHGARGARLPLMLEVRFLTRSFARDAVSDLDPDGATTEPAAGLLLDLSSGGFSMGHGEEIAEGHYIELELPLKRRKQVLPLIGRVLECRPFSGNQWLSHCEFRGLEEESRSLLQQVVRLEQQNRLRLLAPIRRRPARAG